MPGWASMHSPWATGDVATAAELQAITDNITLLGSTTVAEIGTGETTTSTSFTDLTTAGPAVTVTTGTSALVTVQCLMSNNTALSFTLMGFAVSGASSVAAIDFRTLSYGNPAANNALRASAVAQITGLTPGANTFTAKYRVTGGTGNFAERRIIVTPLP